MRSGNSACIEAYVLPRSPKPAIAKVTGVFILFSSSFFRILIRVLIRTQKAPARTCVTGALSDVFIGFSQSG